MNIPCPGCQMPETCRKDRHCNRPRDLEHARRELERAALVKDAADKRWREAMVAFAAAVMER